MRAPVRSIRVTAFLLFLLQVLAQGVLPLADASGANRETPSGAHVESQAQEGCTSSHDHAACVICRVFQGPSVTARADGPLAFDAPVASVTLADENLQLRAAPRAPSQPRAPPLA